MKKEEISFLNQLVQTLNEAIFKLEEYYEQKEYENFLNTKKFIFHLQKKISEYVE
ncbi:MAG: hypothetical protein KKF68_00450 [Nanoarchaeota archaeon]|nr:hypothetical protein [Nanoarchaeota archaeon]